MRLEDILFSEPFRTVGMGGVIGFLVGFTIKRAFKMFLVFLGIYLLSLVWISDLGILTVKWNRMDAFVSSLITSTSGFLKGVASLLPFTGSFLVGLLIGLKV